MYFKKIFITNIILVFVLFKYNLAFDCLPCTCERKEDFISVHCSYKTSNINENKKIDRIPPIPYQDQIGEMDFKEQGFEELNTDLSSYINAENIRFSHNMIKSIHPDTFKKLTFLKTLKLDNNEISSIPSDLFKNNENIQYIFLHNNKIAFLQKHIFDNLPNITEIHLNQNRIEQIEDNCFSNVPLLNTLDLSNNQLKTLGINFIDNPDHLTYVFLDKNPWLCDSRLCELINLSLEANWLQGRIPQCYHANNSKTDRDWEDLQVIEPMKILEFQSPQMHQNVSIICEIHTCSLPTMSWSFDGSFLENSTHCFEGYKHTLTNTLYGITKDDEGLYTCSIENCTFCANSSRLLTVIDEIVHNTTLNESNGTNITFVLPDVDLPDISLPCVPCFFIGLGVGIMIGIIIGIIILLFCLPPLLCCNCLLFWFINKMKSVVSKLGSKASNNEVSAEKILMIEK